ncbi:MAG: 4Fe-4S dicluster domain-containing protein [Candidatus Altiarchaeales archaeon]|nr:4Fe-4S dicluster domain-containing protein [Candidatus Altiarchaeales archaeon]
MTKYELRFSKQAAEKPTLAEAVAKTQVLVNIIVANVEYDRGHMIIDVKQSADELIEYLKKHGVQVRKLRGNILLDDVRCIQCGACYSVCPTEAITLEDFKMVLCEKECINCGACVKACPTRALSLREG